MKKLIFVFVALFVLVLISGCNTRNNNTVRFDDSTDITSDEILDTPDHENTESESMPDISETETADVTPHGKLEITSFDGGSLETKFAYNVVHGTTTSDTYKITINDYKLQKYEPGQTEWSYIAAKNFNTLKDGTNNYVVKTFDKEGGLIDSLMFSIEYEAPVAPEALPDVGPDQLLTLIFSVILAGTYFLFRKLRWL